MSEIQQLISKIENGDVRALSRSITLSESSLQSDQELTLSLLEGLPTNNQSFRIGITGTPGAGKSTLIEALGKDILENTKHKIAVLTIDPSSSKTSGSILGDKTRMNELAASNRTFIRPTASGDQLGGLSKNTRMAVLLCEAAGYNIIIVESVGVGQAETEMAQLTDVFTLVINPGGGDELQGIKRGIMEMADIVVVNKADSGNEVLAKSTAKEYSMALHLQLKRTDSWNPKVITASAATGFNISKLWQILSDFRAQTNNNNQFVTNRKSQNLYWTRRAIKRLLSIKINQYEDQISAQINEGILPERIAQNIINS